MATADLGLEPALRAIRLEKQAAETELADVDRRRRELREAIRDCDRRRDELLDDLVVDRPLLDFAAGRPGPAILADPEPVIPGPAETWRDLPIDKLLPEARWWGLKESLREEDLGTLGAIASWLSDANTLEDLEFGLEEEESRRITLGEVKAIRAALLRAVYHLKIEEEFPPVLIDPEIGRAVLPIGPARKPASRRATPDPGPTPHAVQEPPDGQPVEAPAYTWHSYPIERLIGDRHEYLAILLIAADLDTLGALASWLSDGNDLEDIEVVADDQGDKVRPLGPAEVLALRSALLAKIEELGIPVGEFPPAWVDPDLGRKLFRVEFRKSKSGPPLFLRAFNQMQAAAEAGRRWPDSRAVAAREGEIPPGARVFDAPRETPEERAEQFAAEERARRAEEAQSQADREAAEAEERARAEEESKVYIDAQPKPSLKKAARARAKPAPEPTPTDGLFAVRPSKAKPPLYFVRARSLNEANEHVKASHPRDARMLVSPYEGDPPEGAWIQAAGGAEAGGSDRGGVGAGT